MPQEYNKYKDISFKKGNWESLKNTGTTHAIDVKLGANIAFKPIYKLSKKELIIL